MRFYEQEDGSVLSRFTAPEQHQGYPGRMHGGVITAIMDETIGRAIMIGYGEAIWGVTVELNVRFRKPVPLGVELTAVGRITQREQPPFRGQRRTRTCPTARSPWRPPASTSSWTSARSPTSTPNGKQWYVRPD